MIALKPLLVSQVFNELAVCDEPRTPPIRDSSRWLPLDTALGVTALLSFVFSATPPSPRSSPQHETVRSFVRSLGVGVGVGVAQRLGMEKEEHALRMAIGKSALALLKKMAGEPPLHLSPPEAPAAPPPQPPHEAAGSVV